MSLYVYQEEKIADIWHEIMPLVENNWHEVDIYRDKVELNVNKEFYEQSQEAGTVLFVAARNIDDSSPDFGNLVGYTVTFISHHPHCSNDIFAVNDLIYVDPAHRDGTGVGYHLVQTTEHYCKKRGACVLTFSMKEYAPFEKLMEGTGFEQYERLYSKYIGK